MLIAGTFDSAKTTNLTALYEARVTTNNLILSSLKATNSLILAESSLWTTTSHPLLKVK